MKVPWLVFDWLINICIIVLAEAAGAFVSRLGDNYSSSKFLCILNILVEQFMAWFDLWNKNLWGYLYVIFFFLYDVFNRRSF